ncbi:MAG: hypothetical protein U9R43_09595 [Thermodesulfobacteriota bacterium]|nr:hypothetical protein [Thermodesulfobacteriota bacterium]
MKTKARIILLGQGEGIMKTKARIILLGLVMAIALCYVNFANAESNFATGTAAQSGGSGASARLDFRIVIPEFIYFQVGTIAGTIDEILFTPTANEVYSGTPGIGGSGGDVGGGTVSVVLVSNVGNVEIEETNDGTTGLSDGLGNSISYTQISTTSSNAGSLPAPTLSDAGGTTVTIVPNVGTSVINRSERWTYEYNNLAVPPAAGTYTGQVTYTAAAP